MGNMTYKCVECRKEAEEMRRFEDEIYICEYCYRKIADNVTRIINEFKEW